MRFYLDKDKALTTVVLSKIIQRFQTEALPTLKFDAGYYSGKGQRIMKREPSDPSRPCNRICKNFCLSIVENYRGYLCGQPLVYTAPDDTNIAPLQQVLDQNNVVNADSELLRQALIYGVAYELLYIDQTNTVRFKCISPESIFGIYSNDLDEELLYAVYLIPKVDYETQLESGYTVCLYTDEEVLTYDADSTFTTFVLTDAQPHYFGKVPLVVFDLNTENRSIFESIISMQDAYNSILSDTVDNFDAFVDSYMVLTNVQADAEDLAAMRASRTILLDGDATVSYLTKDTSAQQNQEMLDTLNSSIHTISNSPDFSSEEFNSGVSSGIALQYKLVGFDNIASNIEAQMEKALLQRIDLINQILGLIDTEKITVDIVFTHNLPANVLDVVSTITPLRGLVSDETLLAQLPFIADPATELEKVKATEHLTLDSYE